MTLLEARKAVHSFYTLTNPTEDDRFLLVEAVSEDGALVVRFDDRWFRTVDDFFQKAELGGELVTTCYEELYDFEVI